MRVHFLFLSCFWATACQEAVRKPASQLSDLIDTTWVDGPTDQRTLYNYSLQPIDSALWELTQTGAISLEEGWEAHCFATRGRGLHNHGLRLDPGWTYRELIARAEFARPIYTRHSGLKVEPKLIGFDTSNQQITSILKFRVKNLLKDTLKGLIGHIQLYDYADDTQKGEYLNIILHDTIPPNSWSKAFVSGASKSPERLPNELETDFIRRRRRLIQDWAVLLQDPVNQNWVFVPMEIEFLNGSDQSSYGYEKTRKF